MGVALVVALALGQVGTSLGGFGGQTSGPAGADSAAGTTAIAAHYPTGGQNPAQILLRFPQPVWDTPTNLAAAEQGLKAIPAIQALAGPLNPNGVPLTAAELARLHSTLGNPQALPATPPAHSPVSPRVYDRYRATGQYISADARTVQFVASMEDTSSSPAALRAIPGLRAAVARVAATDAPHPRGGC